MSYFKFEQNDLFVNTLRTHPRFEFYIHNCSVWVNKNAHVSHPVSASFGSATGWNLFGVQTGSVSLYEYNVNRSSNYIYPFIIKGDTRTSFKRLPGLSAKDSESQYKTNYQLGDTITSEYRMSASITRYHYAVTSSAELDNFIEDTTPENYICFEAWEARPIKKSTILHRDRRHLAALRNALKHYTYSSPHYQFSSSFGDKAIQELNLISIPSILYGSSIEKGTLSLKYYITGTLMGELSDYRRNGELVQVGPKGSTGSGSVAGVVLYSEGMVVLTGSWKLNEDAITYDTSDGGAVHSKWTKFAYGANEWDRDHAAAEQSYLSASFLMSYSGSSDIQTMTMFARAPYNKLNYTTNPTFVSSSVNKITTGSFGLRELASDLKNTADHPYKDGYIEYDQSIYISKINVYDEDKNLIGVAKLAKPIRKTKNRQFAFKLKLDI